MEETRLLFHHFFNYKDTPTERKRDEEGNDKMVKGLASKKKPVFLRLRTKQAMIISDEIVEPILEQQGSSEKATDFVAEETNYTSLQESVSKGDSIEVFSLHGRRVVDIGFLFKQIADISHTRLLIARLRICNPPMSFEVQDHIWLSIVQHGENYWFGGRLYRCHKYQRRVAIGSDIYC
ncbi:unnamed protein product [Acanthoscelides obtectus]|uniref:Uncharacterized protein n=1 Tax=Acanthoscelides obtectus TaxID=200917 RepID=A0A9P0JTA3_ACAOB|nr:unnamed protein product [Acanthoscelides obtectus]CAK1634003.1 hypothetical protein AOBTE_LOCUS8530 [Acanthoscelides obtectus]